MPLLSWMLGVALAAPPPEAPPCDLDAPIEKGELSFYVLTAAPGPRPYSFFGHTGLWVRSHHQELDHIWEYGVFYSSRGEPLTDMIMGRMQTGWGVDPMRKELKRYQREDRLLLAQKLDLPDTEAWRLRRQLVGISRSDAPFEDIFHWAGNNCSTMLRDVLDGYVDGALGAALDGPSPLNHRQEVMRHLAPQWWAALGVQIGAGTPFDEPRTRYESAFLPIRLYEGLDRTRVTWPDGSERPLVSEVCTLHAGAHGFPEDAPPNRVPHLWGAGALLASLLGVLGRAAPGSRGARIAGGLLVGAWGLALGALGSVLVFFLAFSEWWGWRPNLNVLLVSPLTLGLVPVGVAWARGRLGSRARWWTGGLAILVGLSLLSCLLPVWPQDSLDLVGGLGLPTVATALAVWWQVRASVASRPTARGPERPPAA